LGLNIGTSTSYLTSLRRQRAIWIAAGFIAFKALISNPIMEDPKENRDDESPYLVSLEELEPSPESSSILDLESGNYTPEDGSAPADKVHGAPRPSNLKLGLAGRGWDYWCM
jgi:hypothetical protein